MANEKRDTVTVKRICNASVERVFQAWVDPRDMKKWWTPHPDWSVGKIQVDARKGGSFSVEFAPPGESPLVERGEYVEFEPPHRIVYLEHVLRDEETLHGPAPCTVLFRDLGDGRTEVTVTSTVLPGEGSDGREQGWGASLDLLVSVFA